jgi:hypothetical protein
MIKQIQKSDVSLSPFVAAKAWDLFNNNSTDLVLVKPSASNALPLALEFIDYTVNPPVLNRDCNIALEQQSDDLAIFQEGLSGSGFFDPATEPQNLDGTFKRLVHDQTLKAFYNSYKNPLEIFGMEDIDFPLSKTIRFLTNSFRMFTVPQAIFGDRITEGSIQMFNTTLDDNVTIVDDQYGNLNAGPNLFSKIQEVRHLNNILFSGTASITCPSILPDAPLNLSVSSGSAILTWTTISNNQSRFAIQKSLDGTSFTDYANITASTATYTDTNVTTSNTYWYQVGAINSIATSSFSNTASITFIPFISTCRSTTLPAQLFTQSLSTSSLYDLV